MNVLKSLALAGAAALALAPAAHAETGTIYGLVRCMVGPMIGRRCYLESVHQTRAECVAKLRRVSPMWHENAPDNRVWTMHLACMQKQVPVWSPA